MLPADYAFTVFLAGAGIERLEGEERRMFRYYQTHQTPYVASTETQIMQYTKEKH